MTRVNVMMKIKSLIDLPSLETIQIANNSFVQSEIVVFESMYFFFLL